MTTILRSVSLLAHEGTLNVPTPLAEIIGQEAVEQEAFNNLLYRGILPKLRKEFIAKLSAELGLKVRPLDPEGKKFPTDAKAEADLLDQYLAIEGNTEAAFTVKADKIAAEIFSACDVASILRNLGTGGSIGTQWLEAADQLMVKVQTERDGDYSRFLGAMRTKVPQAALDDETSPSRECIASILKAYDKAKRAEEISY